MNQDQPYLKQCPEHRISEHYEIKEIYLAYANKSLFNSTTVDFLRKEYTVFLVPVYDADTTPIEDHIAYNACHYSIEDLDNMFDVEYPVPIEQIIVCLSDKVSDQRPSKFSEESFCPACGNGACTCDPSYEAHQQEQYDEYYGLNQKVDVMEQLDRAVKRPPSEIRNSLPAYMLEKKPYSIRAKFGKDDMSTFDHFIEFLNTHEYVYAISNKFFIVHQAYLVDGDSSFTIVDYFNIFDLFFAVELNQDAKDRAAFMNAIGNNQAAPVDELTNTYWLASDVTQAAINVTLVVVIICSLVLGWLFSFNSLLLTAIGCIITLLFYNKWVSTYLNRDRHLSREAFNEKYGK